MVACVVIAVGAGMTRFDDTLGFYDLRADENASYDYAARTYPSENVVGSARVVEDARLWMPQDARYRVVFGPRSTAEVRRNAPLFLRELLLPRLLTTSESASWVVCLGCKQSTLGRRFRLLSDDGTGVLFGRIRP